MKEFLGTWRITGMEEWAQDYIDLVEPGYIKFGKNCMGQFVFGTVNGFLDFRYHDTNESAKVEFSWEGCSENDSVCGRGWAEISGKNEIYGMLHIHCGDESWFKATLK
ncbi:MAG: hypothetical protein GY770_16990 [Aestuariibacter sp.]|nr:hypothetical protein [Aestuariibacter sp.]